MGEGRWPHFHLGMDPGERRGSRQTICLYPAGPPLIIISACANAYAVYRDALRQWLTGFVILIILHYCLILGASVYLSCSRHVSVSEDPNILAT